MSIEELAVLKLSMGYVLRETHLLFTRLVRERLVQFGLTPAQWYFLRALLVENGLTQRELSERANTTNATTAIALRLMERDGLVARRKDPNDRRTVRVFCTPKSRAFRDRIMPIVAELNEITLHGISQDRAAVVREMLAHMRRNLRAEIARANNAPRTRARKSAGNAASRLLDAVES